MNAKNTETQHEIQLQNRPVSLTVWTVSRYFSHLAHVHIDHKQFPALFNSAPHYAYYVYLSLWNPPNDLFPTGHKCSHYH